MSNKKVNLDSVVKRLLMTLSRSHSDPDCYLFIFQGIFDFLSDCSGHFTHILRKVGGKMPDASWEKRKIQGEMKR